MQSGDNAGTSPISEWPTATWSPPDVPTGHSAPLASARVPLVRAASQRSESLPSPSVQPSSGLLPNSGVRTQGSARVHDPLHDRAEGRVESPSASSSGQGSDTDWGSGASDALTEPGEQLEAEDVRSTLVPTSTSTHSERDVALLAAGLGHDLNNLLVGVLGNAELAQAAYLRGEDPSAHLLAVRAAAERASALATSMVRLASDQRTANTSFDLSDLVGEIVMLARAGVSKSAQVVRGERGTQQRSTWPAARWVEASDHEAGKAPLLVRGDSGRIGQVVLNLIVNGADALGSDGGEVRIDVERVDAVPEDAVLQPKASVRAGYARLRVSDTGSGIPAQTLPRIFEPFFSTKRQGRGLGLANCLEIVREHGGGLRVISEVGTGTTFEVYLPLSGQTRAASERTLAPTPTPEWRTSGRVLVVDDEPMVARLTAMVLEHVGLQPTIGHTGTVALELLRQSLTEPGSEAYRLVVVDLTMPDLSGHEVLEQIRALDSHVPVILTSGFSEQQLRQRGAFQGFDGFLQKPFRMTSLIEVLQGLLDPGLAPLE